MTRPHEALTGCMGHTGRAKRGYRPGPRLARALRDTARRSGLTARAYLCPDCGWWHVTTLEEYR